jgi:hypothetical protein
MLIRKLKVFARRSYGKDLRSLLDAAPTVRVVVVNVYILSEPPFCFRRRRVVSLFLEHSAEKICAYFPHHPLQNFS